MKKALLLIFLVTSAIHSFSQNRNSVWCFGDSAGIDFSSGAPVNFASGMDGRGSCTSISDTTGQLLFYAYDRAATPNFTGRVMNKNHSLMLNGDSIAAIAWYNEMTIVPKPGSDSLFYLFSMPVGIPTPIGGLYYSIIDLTQDGGNGAVIQKNLQINSLYAVDALTAIKHGNGRDWWLIFKENYFTNNLFRIYLVTPMGPLLNHTQNIGGVNTTNLANFTFSKDGSKALFTAYNGLIEVMNFDRCTGYFDSAQVIEPEIIANPLKRYWGSAFSPDGSKIYITNYGDTISYLFQYDLNNPSPASNRDTLYTFSNFVYEGGLLRLAPDNKIYHATSWDDGISFNYPYSDSAYNIYNMNLGVINFPDSFGSTCDFQPYSFYLGGKRTYWGLPNNPDYELGALTGSICDTLTATTPAPDPSAEAALYIFYHTAWQKAFINAKALKGTKVKMSIYDVLGNLIYTEQTKLSSQYFTKDVNMAPYAKGMYIINLVTDKERLVKKFIKN